jgi:thioesterase domain-containing protein
MIEEPADPIASLSTHFARQIVSLVKDRPFVLFGHCVGGLLAWHVACALTKEEAPPFRLVLYDAPVSQRRRNATSLTLKSAARSRPLRSIQAYRLAWNDWLLRHEDNWRTKIEFLLWAINNGFMRKGLDRSERGRDNFAKLAYLRAMQSSPLSLHQHDALLIYHHAHAEIVSKSLWNAHSTGEIQFEFIAGDHSDWESAILSTIPLVRHQLQALDALEKDALMTR